MNSRDGALPAGRLLPNEFGLFDTLGSQWEWCLDGLKRVRALPRVSGEARRSTPAPDTFRGVPVNMETGGLSAGGCFDSTPTYGTVVHETATCTGQATLYSVSASSARHLTEADQR